MNANKKIAQNTAFLYLRMLFSMSISLFTSRIILQTLGETDFGIYNIVGGIVILFSFLNSTLSTATQRFLSYELGKGNIQIVHEIFSISMSSYFIISLIILVLCETIGLYFLNTYMNIPIERIEAANWVYQFSILAFICNILRVPYSASIIAYEKMNFYAYSSIIEVTLKLIIVYMLYFSKFDKLIIYSMLMFLTVLLITLLYKSYSNKKIQTTRYYPIWEKDLVYNILKFSGWSALGSFSILTVQQGLNILLNIFWGVSVNAAVGIANQVSSAVYQFVSNFQLAFNPQIIKSYSAGETERFQNLIFCSSKISFFLLSLIAFPIIINIDFILQIWLGNTPHYTSEFIIVILLYMCIDAIASPLWLSTQAHGDIKKYQITISSILFLNLPLAYIAIKLGFSPIIVWCSRLLINAISFFYRCYYSKKYIKLNIKLFFANVIMKIILVSIIAFPIIFIIKSYFTDWKAIIISSITSCIILGITIYYIGLSKQERIYTNTLIKSKIK